LLSNPSKAGAKSKKRDGMYIQSGNEGIASDGGKIARAKWLGLPSDKSTRAVAVIKKALGAENLLWQHLG
jgi:hypothetical protein